MQFTNANREPNERLRPYFDSVAQILTGKSLHSKMRGGGLKRVSAVLIIALVLATPAVLQSYFGFGISPVLSESMSPFAQVGLALIVIAIVLMLLLSLFKKPTKEISSRGQDIYKRLYEESYEKSIIECKKKEMYRDLYEEAHWKLQTFSEK